jgi:hypothetical protein
MPQLEAQVLEHLRTLPIVQQQEVLNFILALSQQPAATNTPEIFPQSFTAAAYQYVGCLESGPSDLSTNPEHMAGFGA